MTAVITVEFGGETYSLQFDKRDVFGSLMETVYRWAADPELKFTYGHANDVMQVAMERMLCDIRHCDYQESILAFLLDCVGFDQC